MARPPQLGLTRGLDVDCLPLGFDQVFSFFLFPPPSLSRDLSASEGKENAMLSGDLDGIRGEIGISNVPLPLSLFLVF